MGGKALQMMMRACAALWVALVAYGYGAGLLGPLSLMYLILGLGAAAATWREGRDLRLIGLALLCGWSLSNAWSVLLPHAPHALKASLYTLLEIFVALAALSVTLHRLCWTMIAIVCTCAFAAAANVIYAATLNPVWSQIHLHELVTNICFALECGFAVWAGRRNCSERDGRFVEFMRPFRHRSHPQHHGAAVSPAPGRE